MLVKGATGPATTYYIYHISHVTGGRVLLAWTCRHDIITVDTVASRYNTVVFSKILNPSRASRGCVLGQKFVLYAIDALRSRVLYWIMLEWDLIVMDRVPHYIEALNCLFWISLINNQQRISKTSLQMIIYEFPLIVNVMFILKFLSIVSLNSLKRWNSEKELYHQSSQFIWYLAIVYIKSHLIRCWMRSKIEKWNCNAKLTRCFDT